MKFQPEYPNHGIQHTRAVVALTVATLCLELLNAPHGTALEKQMVKIRRWVDACSTQTKAKRLSAGAKRDLERCCAKLAPHFPDADTTDDARFRMWAALVWTAWTFVLDVRNTCPLYARQREGRCWSYLLRVLETLAFRLREIEPCVEEQGTAIYEAAAWALEGVDFTPHKEAA